jgi:hypothetical protein
MEREKESLKHRLDQALRDLQILVEWQTANLVLHGKFTMHVLRYESYL